MTRLPFLAFAGAGLLSNGCGQSVPLGTNPCLSTSDPIEHGQVSSLGVSGADVMAHAQDTYGAVRVTWEGEHAQDPGQDTLYFAFGEPIATDLGTQDGPDCTVRTWVQVEVPVVITADSGHLRSEGVVEVRGLIDDDDALRTYVVWPEDELRMPSEVTGPYAAAAESASSGLQEIYLSAGVRGWSWGMGSDGDALGIEQVVGVGADYEHQDGGSSVSLYVCRGDCLVYGG